MTRAACRADITPIARRRVRVHRDLPRSRAPLVKTVAGSLDGIAKDEGGRFYLGDNGNGRLLRYDAAWGSEEVLLTGIGAAANVAFGKGSLTCTDVYVASSGALGRFAGDMPGRP